MTVEIPDSDQTVSPSERPSYRHELPTSDARVAIGVIIVTYNSASLLADCLRSVLSGDAGVQVSDIVVADNDSHDDSVQIAKSFPGVRVVPLDHNAGYAAGINAGLANMQVGDKDAVLILNPDIRLQPPCLAGLAADLRRPGIGIAVPRLINLDGSLQVSIRREPTLARALAEALLGGDRAGRIGRMGELVTDPKLYEQSHRVTWATGAAMLISVDVLTQVGAWDESLLLYGEEVEYALRARDAGHAVWYNADSVAEHVGGDLFTVPVLYALMTVNRVRVYQMRHGRLRGMMYFGVVAAGELLRAIQRRPTARAALSALLVPSRRLKQLAQNV